MRDSDAGSYVCTVSSGSLSVMSNTATLTLKSKCDNNLIKIAKEVYAPIYQEMLSTLFSNGVLFVESFGIFQNFFKMSES